MSHMDYDEESGMTREEWIENLCPEPANHRDDGECPADECTACAKRDCPHGAPEHYWHDGCPTCSTSTK